MQHLHNWIQDMYSVKIHIAFPIHIEMVQWKDVQWYNRTKSWES